MSAYLSSALALIFSLPVLPVQAAASQQELRQEEQLDYYLKWLKEDVVYIMTPEEKDVFSRLSTSQEKDHFIEQFWFRRDPDPRSAANEFKDEHYRRIAYANENFTSGIPGWRTDRGRIYITHGPPQEIRSYPSGGTYLRPLEEGGSLTAVYPFEVWRYRHLEGIGSDVELEFVNKSLTGDYRLSWNPNEKELDPLPESPLEFEGLPRGLVPYMAQLNIPYDPAYLPQKFQPFERYLMYAQSQRPPEIRFRDLKQAVDARVTYVEFPFQVRYDWIRVNSSSALVPLTILTYNRDLTFQRQENSLQAGMHVYGVVSGLNNRIVAEFEDEIGTDFRMDQSAEIPYRSSIYQKKLLLELPGPYKLTLVLKDRHSGRLGTQVMALSPPLGMESSSLILSDNIRQDRLMDPNRMFVLGDLYIRPNVDGIFRLGRPIWAYFQLYDYQLDESSGRPALEIFYRIFRDGQLLSEIHDPEGESFLVLSHQRGVLIHRLYSGLELGQYRFELEVRDRIAQKTMKRESAFEIQPAPVSQISRSR